MIRYSSVSIVDGDKCDFMDSGELLGKGMGKLERW
jgi:hypothetical protein